MTISCIVEMGRVSAAGRLLNVCGVPKTLAVLVLREAEIGLLQLKEPGVPHRYLGLPLEFSKDSNRNVAACQIIIPAEREEAAADCPEAPLLLAYRDGEVCFCSVDQLVEEPIPCVPREINPKFHLLKEVRKASGQGQLPGSVTFSTLDVVRSSRVCKGDVMRMGRVESLAFLICEQDTLILASTARNVAAEWNLCLSSPSKWFVASSQMRQVASVITRLDRALIDIGEPAPPEASKTLFLANKCLKREYLQELRLYLEHTKTRELFQIRRSIRHVDIMGSQTFKPDTVIPSLKTTKNLEPKPPRHNVFEKMFD